MMQGRLALLLALFTPAAQAATEAPGLDLVSHPVGWIALALFALAYAAVVLEERIHLAKS